MVDSSRSSSLRSATAKAESPIDAGPPSEPRSSHGLDRTCTICYETVVSWHADARARGKSGDRDRRCGRHRAGDRRAARGRRGQRRDRGRRRRERAGSWPTASATRPPSSRPTSATRIRCRRWSTSPSTSFGGLDIMFNNAGIGSPLKRFLPDDLEDFSRIMNVNLFGVIVGSQRAGALHEGSRRRLDHQQRLDRRHQRGHRHDLVPGVQGGHRPRQQVHGHRPGALRASGSTA